MKSLNIFLNKYNWKCLILKVPMRIYLNIKWKKKNHLHLKNTYYFNISILLYDSKEYLSFTTLQII